MKGHPAPHPYADRGDLVFGRLAVRAAWLIRPCDPDADAILPPLAMHAELRERGNDPIFESRDEGADVLPAAAQIEHDIGDPLAGPVIGDLAAAAGLVQREAQGLRVELRRGCAGRIERRMFEQQNFFSGRARRDRGHPRLHPVECIGIGRNPVEHAPFHRCAGMRGQGADDLLTLDQAAHD